MALWTALNLDPTRHRAVALVGGGGKSSTMFTLAREGADLGLRVIVTTTTHMLPHPRLPLTDDPTPAHLSALLADHPVITLGRYDHRGKLTGAGATADALAAADLVLMEADGARLLPLKAPASHEPVIPPDSHAVVAVAGLDCIGQAIGAICHRPEQVAALLRTGLDHILTPADVAAVLSSPQGGRKSVGQAMAFRCLLNKADSPERQSYGRDIQSLLARQGIPSTITYYTEEERGGQCLF